MLTEFFAYLRNWFCKARYDGRFVIRNGELQSQYTEHGNLKPLNLLDGQYFRIKDSVLNDGVYIYPASDLKDEEFEGSVWSMAVPADVIALMNEIGDWQNKYGSATGEAMSPFTGETLAGVYSYSKGNSGASADSIGSGNAWQDMFGARLALWRKL